jgi:hypothetical protein
MISSTFRKYAVTHIWGNYKVFIVQEENETPEEIFI